MQVVTMLGQIIESGKIEISTDNIKTLEVKAENKKIDINAVNKKLIKEVISAIREKIKMKAYEKE